MQLTDEGTPVAEIQEGDRFRHWCHGVVTVTDKVEESDRVLLKLDTQNGVTADAYRLSTKIHVLED